MKQSMEDAKLGIVSNIVGHGCDLISQKLKIVH